MHLCYFNSRSLVNKLSNFQSYVYSTPFNVYCITETWLSDFVFDCEILPCGYTFYRKDRASHGGGVLIAVNDLLSSTLLSSPPGLEVITINLNCPNGPITLCTVYKISQIQVMFIKKVYYPIFHILLHLLKISLLLVTSILLTFVGHR